LLAAASTHAPGWQHCQQTTHLLLDGVPQVLRCCHLKRARAQHDRRVVNHILHSTQAITHGVLDLNDEQADRRQQQQQQPQ
jgi:Co/Zn/Cd efflux system component